MQEDKYHRFADEFPMMSDLEYQELVADIRAHGQREPIWLYQGKILDGRNRYKACIELGIKPNYSDFEGTDEEALAFAISMNVVRRHLSTSQRGMIADELATLSQGQRKSDTSKEVSQADAAKLLKTSLPTVQRARKVRQKGTPELVAAVKRGDISVSAAAAQVDAQAAPITAAPVTNGHADAGLADPGHTGDDDPDVAEPDVDEVADGNLGVPDKPARDIVIDIGATDPTPPLSIAFERRDGSLAKYLPEPETIGDAVEILMHVETADAWRAVFPGDDLHRLVDLGDHVKILIASHRAKSKPATKKTVKAKKPSKRRSQATSLSAGATG